MQHGIICPIHDLGRFASRSNYHLVLAHIIEKSFSYSCFYKERSKTDFVTLDNSSYEIGDGVYSPDDLVELGSKVNANEIMAPETFQDGRETAEKVIEFRRKIGDKCKVFGVVHGTTLDELKQCFLSIYKHVDTVGFSCRLDFSEDVGFSVPKTNKSLQRAMKRFYIINEIFKLIYYGQLDVSRLSFHLLGMNHPLEMLWYDGRIRSCDSSCSYLSGCNGIELRKDFVNYVKPEEKIDFMGLRILSDSENQAIVSNISFINSLMNG